MASERISLLARNAEEQRQLAVVYKRAADGRRPGELVGQSAQLAYSWPGNVRELEHLIGRAVLEAMARHKERPRTVTLEPHNLDLEEQALEPLPSAPAQAAPLGSPDANMKTLMGEYQKRLINEALARNQDKWAGVARDLGIDRANLNRLAERLGLS